MKVRVHNPSTPSCQHGPLDNPCTTCGFGVPKTPQGPMSSRDRHAWALQQVGRPMINPAASRVAPSPPPPCESAEKPVQVAPGMIRCGHYYSGTCPPRYKHVGDYGGQPVCRPPDPGKERSRRPSIMKRIIARFRNPAVQVATTRPTKVALRPQSVTTSKSITTRAVPTQPRGACDPPCAPHQHCVAGSCISDIRDPKFAVPSPPRARVLATGPYSAGVLPLPVASCPEGCMYRSDLKCCQGPGEPACQCSTGTKETLTSRTNPGDPRTRNCNDGATLLALQASAPNPWTTWWGAGAGPWSYRTPSSPAVPQGAWPYYGNVWPWNGVNAPMPNPGPTPRQLRRQAKLARFNPDKPVFPGPGAHSEFAPLPPQWFYHVAPTTMGAPAAGQIPAAAPGPPPGVFGQGGRCYADRDCQPDTEYCHEGICVPKPWSPQENPATGMCHCDTPPGQDCKCTVCWQSSAGRTPSCIQFPVPDRTESSAPGRRPMFARAIKANPAEMISITQPLAPGISLR
jgi:hypothetical protein